jgi:predicted phosphoribosyltransferase
MRRRPQFRDRNQAGELLGDRLRSYLGREGICVVALPRGGVPVAAAVARRLAAPLEVLPVAKLGLPGQEELALGALAHGGALIVNADVVAAAGLAPARVAQLCKTGEAELARRSRRYRGDRPPLDIAGRTVILVDDGLATGATMRAAVLAVRAGAAERIVVAVPVAPASTLETLGAEVDEVVCLLSPEPFRGVGAWYADFGQVSDETVGALLG